MKIPAGGNVAYIIGTADTKHAEMEFLRERIAAAGLSYRVIDVGTRSGGFAGDFESVAANDPRGIEILTGDDRGTAITEMGEALVLFLSSQSDLGGIIGVGGSGGTAIITRAMQALPIGTPKVMVSTVASGDVSAYVGPTDICMLYSVTDLAGLNRISGKVLSNAAAAIVGMMQAPAQEFGSLPPAIGLSMFGVTTPLVSSLAEKLKAEFEPLVFHATGIGGQSMERLVREGEIVALLDMTTTEVADYLVGGIMSAGPGRLDSVIESKIPYIGSCGALDMVNFGGIETVPERFQSRNLYVHNQFVTLMRTTREENQKIGTWIGEKLNRCEGPVRFVLPTGGVSAIDAPGAPFYDPQADEALFCALEATVKATSDRQLVRIDANINDPVFAEAIMEMFAEIMSR